MAAELPETLIGLNLGPLRPADVAEGGSGFPADSSGSLRSWYTPEVRSVDEDFHPGWPCVKIRWMFVYRMWTPIEFWIIRWTQKTKEGRTPVIWQDLQCVQDWVYMSSAYKSGAWLLESGIFLIYFDTGWKKSWIYWWASQNRRCSRAQATIVVVGGS